MRQFIGEYKSRTEGKNIKWYILCIFSPGNFGKAEAYLGEYHRWLPHYRTIRIKDKDPVYHVEHLYPGYVFVGAKDPDHIKNIQDAMNNDGYSFYFLKEHNDINFYEMSEDDIIRVEDSCEKFTDMDMHSTDLEVGDAVRISSGPFMGFFGRVLEVGKRNLLIEVDFLSRLLSMRISSDNYKILERYVHAN
jgi:transcription antitermination factor NusG